MDIGVIGAGVAGLASSIALHNFGHNITLYEKNSHISSFGAGVQLSSNGCKVLDYLGVLSEVRDLSVIPENIIFFDAERNKKIGSIPLGNTALERYGYNFLLIHRFDLVNVLNSKANELGIYPKFNSNVSIRNLHNDYVDIDCDSTCKRFPLVIAADGIKSVTRKKFFNNEEPKFLKQIAYRAITSSKNVPEFLRKKNINVFLGSKKHLVSYPICSGALINFVFCKDKFEWLDNEWSIKATEGEIHNDFFSFPIINELNNIFDDVYKWGLFGYKPLNKWNKKNLMIVGDACHPFLPYLAQGTNQALEDAFGLTKFLFDDKKIKNQFNFDKFTNFRKRRILRVYKASGKNAVLFHLKNHFIKIIRNYFFSFFSKFFPKFLLSKFDWLYGFDFDKKF